MRKITIIGNWKMNKDSKKANEFLDEFYKLWKKESYKISKNIQYGLAVPAIILKMMVEKKWDKNLIIAKNMHVIKKDSFAKELAINMIKDAKADAVVLGHSEIKHMFKETDETINKKIQIAIKNKILPIVCVGETIEEYQANKTKEVIENSIKKCFKKINQWDKIIIAYEPIWAIGTGKTSTTQNAQKICKFIRSITSPKVIVQYGGSIKPENIEQFISQPDIDGVLVGTASLNAQSFFKLLTLNE